MAKKGPNDKKEAGNAKKAAAKAEKDNKKTAASEQVESEKWAEGAKGKNNKKEDAEAKKAAAAAKKAEAAKLLVCKKTKANGISNKKKLICPFST
jgi:hypothetical protein